MRHTPYGDARKPVRKLEENLREQGITERRFPQGFLDACSAGMEQGIE